jgi:hypothetical protein
MTRKDWADMTRHPGKFEGQPAYVPYYWDVYLNGFADNDTGDVLVFRVDEGDKQLFPELKRRRSVKLRQTEQGFVEEV